MWPAAKCQAPGWSWKTWRPSGALESHAIHAARHQRLVAGAGIDVPQPRRDDRELAGDVQVGDHRRRAEQRVAGAGDRGESVGGHARPLIGGADRRARAVAGDRIDRPRDRRVAGGRGDRLGRARVEVDLAGVQGAPARGRVGTARGRGRRARLDRGRGARRRLRSGALQVKGEQVLDRAREQGLVARLVLRAHVAEVAVEQRDRIRRVHRVLEVVVADRLVDREQVVGEAVGDQQRRRGFPGETVGAVEQVVRRVVLGDLGRDRLVLGVAVIGLAGIEGGVPRRQVGLRNRCRPARRSRSRCPRANRPETNDCFSTPIGLRSAVGA